MKKMRLTLMRGALLGLLLVGAQSCDRGRTGDGGDGGFSGTVVDSVTGSPIDSATIYLTDTGYVWGFTDSLGHFDGATWGGNIRLLAHKAGYELRWKDVLLGANSEDLLFELPPSTTR